MAIIDYSFTEQSTHYHYRFKGDEDEVLDRARLEVYKRDEIFRRFIDNERPHVSERLKAMANLESKTE